MKRIKNFFLNISLSIIGLFYSSTLLANVNPPLLPNLSYPIYPTYESPDNIKTQAKDFVLKTVSLDPDQSIEVQIKSSDVPTQLIKCSKAIDIALPKEATPEKISALELTCNGDKQWQAYLPVDVQIFTKVVVAKYPLSSETTIKETDLDYAQANVNRLYNGYFKNKSELVGYVASQTINTAGIITKRNVKRPVLVHRNQPVDLIARKNSIQVTMKAVSKSDGSLNDSIEVFNPSSKKTIEAIVTGPNRVEVIF